MQELGTIISSIIALILHFGKRLLNCIAHSHYVTLRINFLPLEFPILSLHPILKCALITGLGSDGNLLRLLKFLGAILSIFSLPPLHIKQIYIKIQTMILLFFFWISLTSNVYSPWKLNSYYTDSTVLDVIGLLQFNKRSSRLGLGVIMSVYEVFQGGHHVWRLLRCTTMNYIIV